LGAAGLHRWPLPGTVVDVAPTSWVSSSGSAYRSRELPPGWRRWGVATWAAAAARGWRLKGPARLAKENGRPEAAVCANGSRRYSFN
jgi:hypothetical protein